MEHEGIDVSEHESIFSLEAIGLKKSDDVENVGALESEDSSASDSDESDKVETDNVDVIEDQLDSMYDQYLSSKNKTNASARQRKRTKVAKREMAAEMITRETALYDGDANKYAEMLQVDKVSRRADAPPSPNRVICSELSVFCSVVKLGIE